jgi:hypothetical protein
MELKGVIRTVGAGGFGFLSPLVAFLSNQNNMSNPTSVLQQLNKASGRRISRVLIRVLSSIRMLNNIVHVVSNIRNIKMQSER